MIAFTRIAAIMLRIAVISAVLMIVLALVLAFIGRHSVANIDDHRQRIETFITENSGLAVELGTLSAQWTGLTPIVEIDKIQLGATHAEPGMLVSGGRADLDLFRSLQHLNPIWREFAIHRLDLTFEEDDRGNWQLMGLSGDGDTELRVILEPLFYSRSISLDHISIDFRFYSGKSFRVGGSALRLENDSNFHRAELSLSMGDQEKPAYVIVEGRGDPLDLETFDADGYIKIEQFDLQQPYLQLAQQLLPQLLARVANLDAQANGEIWFDVQPGGATDFEGRVAIDQLALAGQAELPSLHDIGTDITGWYTPGTDWGVRLQGLKFTRGDIAIQPVNMLYSQSVGANRQDVMLAVERFKLDAVSTLLTEVWVGSDTLPAWLESLALKGVLDDLRIGKKAGEYFAEARLQGVHSLSTRGIPGLAGIDGEFKIRDHSARISIDDRDGFAIDFANIYPAALAVDALQGEILLSWVPALKALTISSDVMQVAVDAGLVSIQFSTRSLIPSNGAAPEVQLLIGGSDIDAQHYPKYLPENLSPKLKEWLVDAAVATDLREFGFALRTGNPRGASISRTSQLYLNVENAALNYHPDWPRVTHAHGVVLVDDSHVQATIDGARIDQLSIQNVEVEYTNPSIGARVVVDAQLSSTIGAAIGVLSRSPLQSSMGPLVDWQYNGQQTTQLSLDIPLASTNTQSNSSNRGFYRASTTLLDGQLIIPNSALAITEIFGNLRFASDVGFQSDELVGRFWGRPLTAQLARDNGDQTIALKSRIQPEKIAQLIDFPWQGLLEGSIPVEGLLRIPPGTDANDTGASLQLTGDMLGTSIALPAPLGKAANEQRTLDIRIDFGKKIERVKGVLGDKLVIDTRFEDGLFDRGWVGYDRAVALPASGQMLFAGYLVDTDLALWQPLVQLIGSHRKTLVNRPSRGDAVGNWEPRVDLRFDTATFAQTTFSDVEAVITQHQDETHLAFRSDVADGLLRLHGDAKKPPNLRLSRLTFGENLLADDGLKSRFDPRKFLDIDVQIEQLWVDGDRWGELAFDVRSEISGAVFADIEGDIFGLQMGADETLPPIEFFWGFDGENYSSRLIGPVVVGDIGAVFKQFRLPKIADSESGSLVFDLNWPAQPWRYGRDNISGDFSFELNSGSFYKSASGADVALKMISLVNFANWLRRLQLDFSDVVGQNMSYNSLAGRFAFDRGMAQLAEPLRMRMPSGRMSMAGDFDLVEETIDGQLVATLPVATNLPWVGALLGGLPAALGVYLTGKLVEKQVDRLSSISYKLSGPWDEMDIKVDKIFAAALEPEPEEAAKPGLD